MYSESEYSSGVQLVIWASCQHQQNHWYDETSFQHITWNMLQINIDKLNLKMSISQSMDVRAGPQFLFS